VPCKRVRRVPWTFRILERNFSSLPRVATWKLSSGHPVGILGPVARGLDESSTGDEGWEAHRSFQVWSLSPVSPLQALDQVEVQSFRLLICRRLLPFRCRWCLADSSPDSDSCPLCSRRPLKQARRLSKVKEQKPKLQFHLQRTRR
jgi:hypothetical protein